MTCPIYNKAWEIIDSSKIIEYMECPRKFFYRHILGWQVKGDNNHLIFGTSWHKAMAFILEYRDTLSDALLAEGAYAEFISDYRRTYSEETDELFFPKCPNLARIALSLYIKKYKGDDFIVLHNEISGAVPIADDITINFRVDAIIRDKKSNKINLLEHKTGSYFSSSWADKWLLSIQIGTYMHVLYCLYDKEDIGAGIVNGAFFTKTKSPSFSRIPIYKSDNSMLIWYENAKHWAFLINKDTFLLAELYYKYEEEKVLSIFPMNTNSCSNYYGCPYRDFCIAWTNPLQHYSIIPLDMEVLFWDPSIDEREVKKVSLNKKKEV